MIAPKEKKIFAPVLATGVVLLYAAVLLTAAYLPALCPLFLAAGLFLLSPMTLTLFKVTDHLFFFVLTASLLVLGILLSPVTGTVLFIACFGSGLVACLLLRDAPDTYMILLKGFGLMLLLAGIAVALIIRARYGVFDFMGAYEWLTGQIMATIHRITDLYNNLSGGQAADAMRQLVKTYEGLTDALICQIAILFSSLMMGQFLWTLIFANTVLKKTEARFLLLPFRYMVIPKSVTLIYIFSYFLGFFLMHSPAHYGFEFSTTMFGWLLVLCGIGVPDLYLEEKIGAAPRMLIKVALLIASFISVCLFGGLLYTCLLILGTFYSILPQGVDPRSFFKRKGR